MALSPIVIILLSVLFWLIFRCFKSKDPKMKHWINYCKATIVILFFIIHPSLVKMNILMLSCEEIDGTAYLDFYMDDECWTGDHLTIVLTVIIPSLVLWGIGIPLIALITLVTMYNDRTIGKKWNKITYGFLFLGYRPEYFFWEIVILARKMLILFDLVFMQLVSIHMQAYIGLAILALSYIIQKEYKPYTDNRLNFTEVCSMVCGTMTIYLGLYYLSGDGVLNEEIRISIFVLILLSNVFFACVWVINFTDAVISEFSFLKILMLEHNYFEMPKTKPWLI